MEYLNKWDFSVIPLLPNKKPLIKWEEYQTRKPTEEEVERWWVKYPDSMIGIVTGKISNLAVIDVDSKDENDIPSAFGGYKDIPTVSTPRGFHFYFRYQDGITNTVNIGGKKIDIRGEGGYVVAPPSRTDNGNQYRWEFSLGDGLPKFPMEILSQTETAFHAKNCSTLGSGVNPTPLTELPASQEGTFIEGRRDSDLFHAAHLLIKGGMEPHSCKDIIMRLAQTCDPPFPTSEAKEKVDSAVKRAVRKERPLATEIEEWVMSSSGIFLSSEVFKGLQLSSREEGKNLAQILRRLSERGVIEKAGGRNACWRRIEGGCELIDWKNAPTEEVPLKFPLGIEEHVKIFPKSIIMIAGKSDAGKTAFLLEFARMNQNRHEIHLFINEAGDTELADRLGMFRNMRKDEWKCHFWEREDNFADVIKPNAINIIDYLDVTKDFSQIGEPLKQIHNKLDRGVVLIAIQKNPNQYDFRAGKQIDVDLGVGGAKSIGKARLYLAIDDGILKIVKAKGRRGRESSNGMTRTFGIYDGHSFEDVGLWKRPQ